MIIAIVSQDSFVAKIEFVETHLMTVMQTVFIWSCDFNMTTTIMGTPFAQNKGGVFWVTDMIEVISFEFTLRQNTIPLDVTFLVSKHDFKTMSVSY